MTDERFHSDRERDPIAEITRLIGQADRHRRSGLPSVAFVRKGAMMNRPSCRQHLNCLAIAMLMST